MKIFLSRNHKLFFGIVLFVASVVCCHTLDGEVFHSAPFSSSYSNGTVESAQLSEISGIAASSLYPNTFWVHNDSGNSNQLYLINLNGKTVATLTLEGVKNRDWEDIALCNGYIYLGEIGDNDRKYSEKIIYKIPEPTTLNPQLLGQKLTVSNFEKMAFTFSDAIRDCETLMIDPQNEQIVLVTKRESQNLLYTTNFKATNSGEAVELSPAATLPISQAVGGDISHSGNEIVIKNYNNIYYWKRKKGETIAQTVQNNPRNLPYTPEPQGEAIAWNNSDNAIITLSERQNGQILPINIYNRK